MKIAMTGATGFVGTHVRRVLAGQGHEILPLGRDALSRGAEHLAAVMSGCDTVINLAGAPINRRWTADYKRAIFSSRVDTTELLVEAMGRLEDKPATFISTSAIGAFDAKGQYTEFDQPNANDFLGRLAHAWEGVAREAESIGVRTVIFRFGLVLGHDGGLMKQVLTPFRLGLGGPIGDGSQHFSWVHVDDVVSAYLHVLERGDLSGVFHVCAPTPVTNRVFTTLLGTAVNRPALLRVPEPLLRLAFGEGAEVMTSGQRVVSRRLPESGFRFRYPDLNSALRAVVGQTGGNCPLTAMPDPGTAT